MALYGKKSSAVYRPIDLLIIDLSCMHTRIPCCYRVVSWLLNIENNIPICHMLVYIVLNAIVIRRGFKVTRWSEF